MKTASWIILALVGALTLLGSIGSASIAYRSLPDQIGSANITELAAGKPDVATALRARRGTAAAYAAGFAAFFLLIALGPYRKGDRWAWWAILIATLAVAVIAVLRVPLLDIQLGSRGAAGAGTAVEALMMLGVVAVGLALGAGRLKGQ
jgi:hypothetical protein